MPEPTCARHRHHLLGVRSLAVALLLLAGCAPQPIEDPLATLTALDSGARRQMRAMTMLDETPDDEAYIAALHRAVWRPGYAVEVREAAVDRLAEYDPEGLRRTLRQQLPRMTAWAGLTRLCEIIAERGWIELTPALVSSWARPSVLAPEETDRPEFIALAKLHGAENVPDVVFDLLVTSRRVSQQGLRTRCWELLLRLGDIDRLRALLMETELPADDAFMIDLQAGARELGIIPANREEILWLRSLRMPERAAFWDEAVAAVGQLPERRRDALELRDLAVTVAAARHDPELLTIALDDLYARVESAVRAQRHYSHGSDIGRSSVRRRERLHEWKGELTWGDLAAMLIAARALDVPQVVAHLFDYADRDHEDESTEYGGVIALDEKGRFEIIEFLPRVREHDRRFNAPQAMLDAAYTAIFHFHLHAQRHRNEEYAGPGFGDQNYAENTRANCLVLTFVREDAMNVDFYRHGRVQVDLGVIER
jgi:hypothetical protein